MSRTAFPGIFAQRQRSLRKCNNALSGSRHDAGVAGIYKLVSNVRKGVTGTKVVQHRLVVLT
jgi:hypothetical protein